VIHGNSKKSLIRSTLHHQTVSANRVVSLTVSLALILLAYTTFSVSNVFAVPPDPGFNSGGTCGAGTEHPDSPGVTKQTCCWTERVPGKLPPLNKVTYCQTCYNYPQGGGSENCDPKQQQFVPASGVVLPEEGVLQQTTPPPTSPFAPLGSGGVVQQQPTTTTPTTPPPLFGRNVPLQGGGIFGQQPAAIVPPTPVPTPVLTPEPPVPMFGSTQRAAPPQFGQIAPGGQILPPTGDEGLTGVAPRTAEPLTRICPVGNVWDPRAFICVPDVPPLDLELCPDGTIPQQTGGPGGTQAECPPSEAQQLRSDQPEEQEAGQPEEPQAEEEQQSSAE
jgi:hypothetical protein